MNERLIKWSKWLKVIHDDIQALLINRNIFWEVQNIIKHNKDIQKPNSFYQYLGNTYVAYSALAIRRQIKNDARSISFSRLLSEIIEDPLPLSRTYFKSLYAGSAVKTFADRDFDKFAGANKDHICPMIVRNDLEALKMQAKKIEDFADRRIAHHDKKQPKSLPTFSEVDDCINLLDHLYVKYHLVFHASSMTSLMPVYQYDWKAIFQVPWLSKRN
jgi:hypothetical protein